MNEAASVWVTRAEPGAASTAERLKVRGFTAIVAPLLSFRALPARLRLGANEALAFTSANAVARAAALTEHRAMPVFAVGDATAEAAREAGFRDVVSAHGDVETLAALIIRSAAHRSILHPAAQETAGDLVGRLSAAGITARKIAIYETEASARIPHAVDAELTAARLAAVLLHSPKAARVAAALLQGREGYLARVCAVGLSAACVEPLRSLPFRKWITPPEPNEASMLDALSQTIAGS